MTEHGPVEEQQLPRVDAASPRARSARLVVVLVVVSIFAGIIAAKVLTPASSVGSGGAAGGSITSVHNDAMADYEAASRSGKPVYVLFLSLS